MPTTLYIDGAWTTALDGGTRDIHCPANGEFVATVDEASGRPSPPRSAALS